MSLVKDYEKMIPSPYKKAVLLIAVIINGIVACAQLKITGKINDSTNAPVVYATLRLMIHDTVNQTALSDSIGGFIFSGIAPGNYKIQSSYVGIKSESDLFRLDRDTVINIIIGKSSSVLKTVTITASKPLLEKKIDRMVFNIENSIAAKGTDLLEALALAPMLRVSDNGISIVGKGGVSVMINERILHIGGADLVNYLRSLRSDDVEKIEVITTPPAKYEAQGNSGMINIVLKKNPSLGWSGNLNSTYSQGIYPSLANNTNLNYQSRKLSGSLKLRQYQRESRITEETNVIGNNSILSNDPRKTSPNGIGANLSIDYKIDKNSNAGIIYDIGKTNSDVHIDNSTVYQTNNITDSVLTTISNHKNPAFTQTLNIYYDHKFDSSGKKISNSFNLFSNAPETIINFETQSDQTTVPDIVRSYSGIEYKIWSLQSDLILPYRWGTLETGLKFTNFDNNSDISYHNFIQGKYIQDTYKSNLFDYNEQNFAGYISLQKNFHTKWSAKAGLRYEYSIVDGYSPTTGESNKTEYGKLFPTAYLSYKANVNNSFGITYSKRINRPFFRALNPARWYSNPYTYYTGNPLLKPSYNHNMEVSYLYKGFLSVSVFGEKSIDGYGFVVEMDNGFKIVNSKNYLTQYNYGLVTSLNLKFFPWWENSSYVTFSVSDSRSSIAEVVTQRGSSFSYSSNNSFSVSKIISLFVNFSHSLPSTRANIYSAGQAFLAFGWRIAMLKNKLQFNTSINDIFKTSINKGRIDFKGFSQYYYTYFDTQRINLSITYSFGKAKVRGNQKQINFKEVQRAN